eukprot:Hpha_TRINITY_DN8168_c1_g1::TRINITY_DN8168_c1_g1_i1::g.172138::m.172138
MGLIFGRGCAGTQEEEPVAIELPRAHTSESIVSVRCEDEPAVALISANGVIDPVVYGEQEGQEGCVVCMERPKEVVFEPCRHFCCCKVCAIACEDKCPMCTQDVEGSVFLASGRQGTA